MILERIEMAFVVVSLGLTSNLFLVFLLLYFSGSPAWTSSKIH